jgi:hypothetical protein
MQRNEVGIITVVCLHDRGNVLPLISLLVPMTFSGQRVNG